MGPAFSGSRPSLPQRGRIFSRLRSRVTTPPDSGLPPASPCHRNATDAASLSPPSAASRNEENELLRQQMGPEAVMALLQGSGVDAEAALLRLGRLEGRVGGSGPAGSLEDLKRVWSVPLPATSVLFFAGLLILPTICLLSATRRTAAPSTSSPKGCWLLTALADDRHPYPPKVHPERDRLAPARPSLDRHARPVRPQRLRSVWLRRRRPVGLDERHGPADRDVRRGIVRRRLAADKGRVRDSCVSWLTTEPLCQTRG